LLEALAMTVPWRNHERGDSRCRCSELITSNAQLDYIADVIYKH
jgi:hypothetical protein